MVFKEVWLKNIYEKNKIVVEEGDLVIDIGAHIGIFSTYAAELNKTGKIYAFEPFKDNFKRLGMHKEINCKKKINTYNLGIADKKGSRTLFISDKNTVSHSLYKPKNNSDKVEIKTIRLSEFCKKENINKIDFLKTDCEGAEFEILKADVNLLKIVNKLVLECHPFKDNNASFILNLLEKYNFKVYKEPENITDNDLQMIYAIKK